MPGRLFWIAFAVTMSFTALAAADSSATPGAIRARHAWISHAMAIGMAAPTFAALVSRVAESPLIVHIEPMQRDSAWDGRTRFVAAGGGYRYVRIELRRGPLLTTAAVLAHELRHALEIHDAGVETTDQFEQLYRRIGTGVSGAPGAYDTAAAIDAGVATLAELTGRPVAPPASNRRLTASPPGTPTLRTRPLPKRRAAVATP